MRIQIVDDNGEVVYSPAENRHLEADIRLLLAHNPEYGPLVDLIDRAVTDIRQATLKV